jgi:nucleotide-binding universal stress UspA family protein
MLTAGRILSPLDREVDLVCVMPEVRANRHPTSDKARRRAAKILEHARCALAGEGISVGVRLETGSPARTLIHLSSGYDLTVVGAKSREDLSVGGLGPVASRVLEHSVSSVLIARETRNEPGLRILAPVDGSDLALRAIDQLAPLVDLSTADVTLMHVVETPWLHAGPDQEWLGIEEEVEEKTDPQAQFAEEFEREAEAVIEEARTRLPVRTAVTRVIERGLPADAILAEADSGEYDLVVTAASGATDLKHQMLGSVSAKIAWNAPCSVLLVRASS